MLIRFVALLLFYLPTSAAMAVIPPGPPPWSCSVLAACNALETCIFLDALPMQFTLTPVDGDAKKFNLKGYDGYERAALEFSSIRAAKRFAKTFSAAEPTPFILIRNDRISDAHGFWLQTISLRDNGQHIIAEAKMLVACNSIWNR